ncbi:MAG TPA: coenzyme F420-0:L-glutamate ligase [Pilimelia sp.]|nr:coenzyme F420-0:L-glutamate ligase [Pilimelia sp.]
MPLEIVPLTGMGEVRPGDDLAAMIVAAGPWLRAGDVLVVTSKVVSKAEGRLVDAPAAGPARDAAREAAITAETARLVARRGPTRIVQTHHGFVMAAAGVDASNVAPDKLVLLPKDPDAAARGLRAALRDRFGLRVAVIVSDTMGRTWRVGLTDVALGAAGLPPVRDHRGEVDPYGNELQLTQMAIVDEMAGAAELVKGKHDGVPVAVVRGYPGLTGGEPDGPGVAALIRDPAEDLFSLGTAEARAEGLRAAATLPATRLTDAPPADTAPADTPPVDPAAIAAALATVRAVTAPGTRLVPVAEPAVRARLAPGLPPTGALIAAHLDGPTADTTALLLLGADLHRLRAALAAQGLASTILPAPAGDPGAPLALVAAAAPRR